MHLVKLDTHQLDNQSSENSFKDGSSAVIVVFYFDIKIEKNERQRIELLI